MRLEDNNKSGGSKRDDENAKFGRYVAAFCAGFMQGGVLCYCVVIAFSTEIVSVGNETKTVHMLPCAFTKNC